MKIWKDSALPTVGVTEQLLGFCEQDFSRVEKERHTPCCATRGKCVRCVVMEEPPICRSLSLSAETMLYLQITAAYPDLPHPLLKGTCKRTPMSAVCLIVGRDSALPPPPPQLVVLFSSRHTSGDFDNKYHFTISQTSLFLRNLPYLEFVNISGITFLSRSPLSKQLTVDNYITRLPPTAPDCPRGIFCVLSK
ncbi:hypothetical protein SKAU_G00314240 [Synaphobranchus kaupii]|uniref:Uncharacterized protein n=1 Tax=Synaphobranchus kaupii TaxID=118154 RepID=A0A9Q1ILN3_SYNKA|nr:hypothetical protein SKAU_G00314240 [Synaphobranchus kaupii]